MTAATQNTPQQVDVVIVGGGLVGGLCALLLAEAGVKLSVIDAAPPLTDETRAKLYGQRRCAGRA